MQISLLNLLLKVNQTKSKWFSFTLEILTAFKVWARIICDNMGTRILFDTSENCPRPFLDLCRGNFQKLKLSFNISPFLVAIYKNHP